MNLSKSQIAIFGIIAIIVLFFTLIFTGIMPGLKKNQNEPKEINGEITIWIYEDEIKNIDKSFESFRVKYKNPSIKVRSFKNYLEYRRELLSSMAGGYPPDIFTIPSTEIPNFLNKITPLSTAIIPVGTLKALFPQVVLKDVVFGGNIYGLPLSIDTLALIYNRDMFAKAGIVRPPADWYEFADDVKKLTVKDENGQIIQSGVALGGSNVNNVHDVLYALLLQFGNPIVKVSPDGSITSDLNENRGRDALKFISQFASPKNEYYTWDIKFPFSLDAFASGKTAMIFDYQSSLDILRSKNSFLNYDIAPFPQVTSTATYVAIPKYLVFAVSRQAKNPSVLWDLIYSMTTNEKDADSYIKATGKPPALLSLIEKYSKDPQLSVFARQALYAKSWYGPNRDSINEAVSQALDLLILDERKNLFDILDQIQSKIVSITSSGY